MRRQRLECFDLFVTASGFVGWRVVHDGARYQEIPVMVDDLTTLPERARVYVESMRWRRP